MYQQYLILFAEITRNKKTRAVIEGEEFIIDSPRDGMWILSLPLMSFEGKIPSKIAECIFSCSLQSFSNKGPSLQKDGQKIILRSVTKEPGGFVEFKTLVSQLAFMAKEWRETLRELGRQSPSKSYSESLFFAY